MSRTRCQSSTLVLLHVVQLGPGVVHEDVEVVPPVGNRRGDRGDVGLLANVAADRPRRIAEAVGERLGGVDRHVGDAHLVSSATKRRTVAAPMPLAPPVTMAARPCNASLTPLTQAARRKPMCRRSSARRK